MYKIILFLYLLFVMLSVAFFTLLERKLLSSYQIRIGPNKVYLKGYLQSFMDVLKLSVKSINKYNFNLENTLFLMMGILLLFVSLFIWNSLPFFLSFTVVEYVLMFFMCCLGFALYPLVGMSWFSNNKFSYFSSFRIMSQFLSYEMLITMFVLSYVFLSTFFLLKEIFFFFLPIYSITMLIIFCMELSRPPFDFSESESELVAGFMLDYSSINFSLVMLSEYAMMLFFSWMFFFFFFDVMLSVLLIMTVFLFFRSLLLRFRIDDVLLNSWKILMPVLILLMFIHLCVGF